MPHVSFIVPTRNSASTLEACLNSLRRQTAGSVEVIVVDNDSRDGTVAIAESCADVVLHAGPERSAQRNAGAHRSTGDYLAFIDSDMVARPDLAAQITNAFENDAAACALVITEIVRNGGTFWSQCRRLEKIAYFGDETIEAARVFRRDAFFALGGFDEMLHGPEDWELTDRLRRVGLRTARVVGPIEHDESELQLGDTFRKKRYYGRSLAVFFARRDSQPRHRVLRSALLKPLRRLPNEPHHVFGLYTLKLVEGAGAAIGFLEGARDQRRRRRSERQ